MGAGYHLLNLDDVMSTFCCRTYYGLGVGYVQCDSLNRNVTETELPH